MYLNIYLEVICKKQSQGFSNALKVLEVIDVEAEKEGTENLALLKIVKTRTEIDQ